LSNNSGTFQKHSKNYQSHFWPLGTKWPRSKKKNCGSESHVQRECDIKAMINHMKNLKFWLQEKGKCGILDEVHVVDEIVEKEPLEGEGKYVEWDRNITTCILDADSHSFCANDYQPVEYTTKQIK
jgi:hypothetical protein